MTSSAASAAQFQSEANLLTFDPTVTEIKPRCYPQALRGNVSDNYHGTTVFDPYRALEDPDAEDTKKFVTQLNSLSEPFLEACPVRDKLREKLTKLWDYEKFSCTSIRGDFFYYYHNTGLQTEVLGRERHSFPRPEYFFGRRHNRTFKMCSGEELSDRIPGVKFSGIAWLHDNSGLFYSSYPELRNAAEGPTTSSTKKHEFHSIYFHKMGTDSKEDILVAQSRENPDKMLGAEVSDDGRFLFVTVRNGCDPKNQLFYYDLSFAGYKITEKIELLPLFDKCDAEYEIMDSDENTALILTNHEAPMFKLVRVKLGSNGGKNQNELWQVVVGEDELRKLEWAAPVDKDKLIVCYMEDVKNTIYIHAIDDGRMLYQMPLPIGSLSGVFARKSMSKIFVGFESFLVPTVVFHGDFSNCPSRESPVELREIRRINVPGLDYNAFEAKQVFYPSKDGTQIPMYVVHRKDMQLDGSNATILNGYGGFSISQLPSFSVSRLMLVQHFGFVWATANIRGGSEYGEKWHEAGMRDRKQTVFDDFISAAEFLISNKYTCNKKLAIHGGSNGGLLTAACCQQRPDLFAAVVTRVGVLDMLRFNKFTIGAAWVKEFGDPDEPGDFPFIYEYSPLHRLSLTPGKNWPATLLMSADHDDRVVPLHTLKYIAQLYHLLRTEAEEWQRKPVLARIEVKAGHGAGKPTAKMIAELVDLYCFLQRVLELKWNE
uniref:Prolyl endopeptidase n=1 Tax=Globodera pallida TaxID=36090 RepID=A0A183BKL7_GLOPA